MSNYLDFSVKTREQFKQWILTMLGEPLVTVELADSQLEVCVDNAVEKFTEYAVQEQSFIHIELPDDYEEGVGALLPDNVMAVFSMNDYMANMGGVGTLFSVNNSMWNAGLLPNFHNLSNGGSGWVTYELAMQYVDMIRILTGKGFDFEYNPRTKRLILFPDGALANNAGHIVLGVYILRPDDQQYGESWCKKYALAEGKIILGRIRNKFAGVQLLGGGTISVDVLQEGLSEKAELEEKLRLQYSGPYGFFCG